MTIEEAYKLYTALRLHFTTDKYNITETQGRVRCSIATLSSKPKLRFFLEKYARKYPKRSDFILFLVANFVHGDSWGGVYAADPDAAYFSLQGRHEQLTYRFKQDLTSIHDKGFENIEDLWMPLGKRPAIQTLYYSNTLALETIVILNKLYKYSEQIDSTYTVDPVWPELSRLITKYAPFVKTDKEKFRLLVESSFT